MEVGYAQVTLNLDDDGHFVPEFSFEGIDRAQAIGYLTNFLDLLREDAVHEFLPRHYGDDGELLDVDDEEDE